MKKIRLALLAGFFLQTSLGWADPCWRDGEKLTYEVHWGLITAAEAIFSATQDDEKWVMNLDLKSKGVVETLNPIRSRFTSTMQTSPWRSLAYEEKRSEGKKFKQNRTTIEYPSRKGHYEDLLAKTSTDFTAPQDEMDDVGSLLYGIREQDWGNTKEKLFVIYDCNVIKYGRVRFIKKTEEAIGTWPKQKLLVVEAWPEDKKGVRKKGSLKLWITDDEKRLPLRADFEARFGTFQIDLVKAENVR